MMKRKLIALVLCLTMAAASFAGLAACSKEDYDFVIWSPNASDAVSEIHKTPVFQHLEQKTGIKVKIITGDYSEVNRMYSTKKYYDVMIQNEVAYYDGGVIKAIESGLFWDLHDYILEHAPNYLARLNEDESRLRNALTDNSRFSVMYQVMEEQPPYYGYLMREDWLRKIDGYQNNDRVPQTYAEWEHVLTEFKKYNDNDYSGNSKAPLFINKYGRDPFNFLSAGFGGVYSFYKDNGKIKYGPMEQGFKDYLDLMQKWYSLGLIDPDFETSDDIVPTVDALETSATSKAKYGAFPHMYTYIENYENLSRSLGSTNYTLVSVPYPRQTADQVLQIGHMGANVGLYFAVTNKVKDAETVVKIVKWFDYLYSIEGTELINYGIEGLTYTKDEQGNKSFTELITENTEKELGGLSDIFHKYVSHLFPSYYEWERELLFVSEKEQAATHTWMENIDNEWELTEQLTMTSTENDTYTKVMTSVDTYVSVFISNYIRNNNPVSFSEFVRVLKEDLKIQDAIDAQQAAYDRMVRRQAPAITYPGLA